MANKLSFEDAEKARDSITASEKQKIESLYEEWAKQIAEKAKQYEHKGTPSAPLKAAQLKELEKAIKKAGQQVANEVNGTLKQGIEQAAQSVVSVNQKWLESLGFPKAGISAAFSNVPSMVVQNLVTGKIYQSGWSLSKSIWGDNEDTLGSIYEIVAAGQAQNKSIYEISKDLEKFVKPGAKKSWNLTFTQKDKADGKVKTYKVYPKKVDYNAQRLARTLSQHGYQQTIKATTMNNPFVQEIRWWAIGGRACPLCLARHGKLFKKNDLPMDHPNGMCIMEPVVDPNMDDKLIAWVNSPDGTFPEIDGFAKQFGYGSIFSDLQEKYLAPYGFSPDNMPKTFDDWSHKVTYEQADEILKSMGTSWADPHPYQQLMKFYDANLASVKGGFKASVKDAITSKKAAPKKQKVAEFTWQQKKFLQKYGYSTTNMPKNYSEWAAKLTEKDLWSAADMASKKGMSLLEYYEEYIGKIKYKWKEAGATSSVKGSATFDKDVWLSKIKGQSEYHMLELEDEAMKAFGEAGINGLKVYTGSSYTEMNGYLRYLAAGKSEEEARSLSGITSRQLKALEDARNALNSFKTTEDLVLRRGTDLGDLAGFLPGDFRENKRNLASKTAEELNDMFSGAVGTYAGFTSTSSLWDRGFSGNVEVVFYAPKGTSASSIMKISQYGTAEGETLLNAGTQVRILSIEKSDGHMSSSIRVFVEIV